MDKNIGVGAIVGLVTASSLYVWNSESFTKNQKIFLLCCVFFFPLQWIGILVILAYNNHQINNTEEKITERKTHEVKSQLNSSISNLTDLKDKGILTNEEYKEKVQKIEADKKEQDVLNSTEYKQLKSLYNSGVLTKDEFESKIDILKNKFFKDKKESNDLSNSIIQKENYDKDIELVNGKILTIHNFLINQNDDFLGLKVSMNNKNVNDDFYISRDFIFKINHNIIVEIYKYDTNNIYNTKNLDLSVYSKYLYFLSEGDFIFNKNNFSLINKTFKLDGNIKIIVENGRITKIYDNNKTFISLIVVLLLIIVVLMFFLKL